MRSHVTYIFHEKSEEFGEALLKAQTLWKPIHILAPIPSAASLTIWSCECIFHLDSANKCKRTW